MLPGNYFGCDLGDRGYIQYREFLLFKQSGTTRRYSLEVLMFFHDFLFAANLVAFDFVDGY